MTRALLVHMNYSRLTLAHFLPLLLIACGTSHGMDPSPDSGPSIDGGPLVDAHVSDSAMPYDGAPIDASPVYDAMWAPDSGVHTCRADEVSAEPCPDTFCDAPDLWYWNGHECFPVSCGACVGEGCDHRGFSDEESCLSSRSFCPALECESTGGTWRFWGVDDCRFQCGVPDPAADCFMGAPTCDCGAYQTFQEGLGCVEDGECRTDLLPMPPPEIMCETTGGEWGSFCAPARCGVPSLAECLADACNCPWPQLFEPERGCYEAEVCFRGEGGCDERSICPAGTACQASVCEPVLCSF